MRTFKDQLALGLTLKGAATKVIAGGDIKSVDLHLTNWGWSGTIEFDIFDDAASGGTETDNFLPSYFKSQLIQIELRIADHLSDEKKLPDPPLVLKGLVTRRALREFPDSVFRTKMV